MEIKEFIKNFAALWDETEAEQFTAECEFHELEEWSSLVGLAILNMIVKKYNVRLTPEELKACRTIQNVFTLLQTKQ